MLTFTITAEERQHAQRRAAELDIAFSGPPGTHPFVWDNRQNCVKRWYNYRSGENKIGTVYFEPVIQNGQPSGTVQCRTEITHHPISEERDPRYVAVDSLEEHQWLAEAFLAELLA